MEDATITSSTRISPDVRQYEVTLETGAFDGEAGQHTVIHKPEEGGYGTEASRPYSVLGIDDDTIILMIRTYDDGTVSPYMAERDIGDTIHVDRSLSGNLTLQRAARPVVFISTGTGITPMTGMLHEYIDRDGPHATFLFGDINREQLLYKAMLTQLGVTASVDVEFVLSRESWEGRKGYVQTHLDDVFDTFEGRDYYVCGVPAMVVETNEQLHDRGVPEDRIFTEGWERSQIA